MEEPGVRSKANENSTQSHPEQGEENACCSEKCNGELSPSNSDHELRASHVTSHSQPSSNHSSAGIKLFLGGLAWDTTEDTLQSHFEKYGEVVKVEVMRERNTGQPRGFGFVTFPEEEVANAVCRDKHLIDGRQIEAKRSVPPGSPPPKSRSRKIFVGGLAPETTDDQFRDHFSQFGTVTEATIMQDHNSGRSRGFGFVTFDSEDSVGRVFRAGNMQMLAGKKVEVKNATPRGSGSPQPGASKGSGRGPSAGKTQMQRATMPHVGFEVQGAVPYGMMGYGVGYGVGGYGMGFPAPYGVYGGMMMGYGYDPGYHGGFPYGVPYLPHQDSTGDPAFASGDPQAFGAARYHPYSR